MFGLIWIIFATVCAVCAIFFVSALVVVLVVVTIVFVVVVAVVELDSNGYSQLKLSSALAQKHLFPAVEIFPGLFEPSSFAQSLPLTTRLEMDKMLQPLFSETNGLSK